MGFFEDIFRDSAEHRQVQSYFSGSRSNYEAMRLCICDMLAPQLRIGVLKKDQLNKVRDELFHHCGELVMRDFFSAALLRCLNPTKDVTLVRPASGQFIGKAVTSETAGVTTYKSSDKIRFDLLTNDQFGWAWVSLYDDGTRMRPSIEMLEGNGWSTGLKG